MTKAIVYRVVFFIALFLGRHSTITESKRTSWKIRSGSRKVHTKKLASSAGKASRKSRRKIPCARSLPKEYINDDFCDCVVDGTDEPGR